MVCMTNLYLKLLGRIVYSVTIVVVMVTVISEVRRPRGALIVLSIAVEATLARPTSAS